MNHRISLLASGLLLLAGCAMGPQAPSPGKGATLILEPALVPADYQAQARREEFYTEEDVNHVVVRLFTVTDGVEAAVTRAGEPVTRVIPRASLSVPVVFDHLRAQTTYRAKCEAIMVTGEPSVETAIGTNDAHSQTDIVVTDDDRPTVGALKVRLKARPFSGTTGFDVIATDGTFVSEGAETLADGGLLER